VINPPFFNIFFGFDVEKSVPVATSAIDNIIVCPKF